MGDEAKKRLGRPPGGAGKPGEPERIRDWPKVAVSTRPAVRALLNAISMIEGKPAWKVVEEGIGLYVERMSPEDRKAAENVARRVEAKQHQG